MIKTKLTFQENIENLKTDFKFEELKGILWEWYKHTVNGSFNTSTSREEREIITSVYERFAGLIDALYQKESKGK